MCHKKLCYNCIHFFRHYAKRADNEACYVLASGGHCTYPRMKLRWNDTPACKHYQPRPEAEEEPRT